jgi:hypothetical protein
MSTAASPLAPVKYKGSASLGCIIPFGLLFAAVGFVAFYFVSLRPVLRASASSDWPSVECVILDSKLATSRGSKGGTTYRVEVRYRYTWSGHAYDGDRYDFSSGFTNVGVDAMRAAVASLPAGRRTVCYVDPDSPSTAVLSRKNPVTVWFGAFTLIFPAVGLGIIFFSIRSARRDKSPLARANGGMQSSAFGSAAPQNLRDYSDHLPAGEVLLKPVSGRVAAFIGITFIALFWNGIVSVFVYNIIKDFRSAWSILPALFMIPFVAVGLLLLALAVQAFSRLFAPPVEVRLDPSRLHLGGRVPFTWRLGGSGVRKLTIRLVGREEATYQQGTRTTTDKSDFHRSVLIESTDALSLSEGRGELILPADHAAPAFDEKKNRIVWELAFDGDIPWRADVDDRFVLAVRSPAQPPGLADTPEPQPRTSGGLTLWTVDRFAPGETLVFTLSREPGSKAEPLTVQLGWFTEGKGTRDAAVIWREALPDLAPGADRSFEVPLPLAPWSFAGKLVAVEWRLEVLDSNRNPLVAVPLVIAPGGNTVSLPALPKESPLNKWKSRFKPQVAR